MGRSCCPTRNAATAQLHRSCSLSAPAFRTAPNPHIHSDFGYRSDMSSDATRSLQQSARFTRSPASAQETRHPAASILARLDRIDVWSLPFLFIGIIGTGFLFTFRDDEVRVV